MLYTYKTLDEHCLVLMRSGFGFSFYDGPVQRQINLDPHHLGLIICEHPWTRTAEDRWDFLTSLARSFLSQHSNIPKILEVRLSDWRHIYRNLTQSHQQLSRRIQLLREDRDQYQSHYTPLRQYWTSDVPDEIHARHCAIIFHPTNRRFQFAQPLHVPECVLKEIFQNRRTLFLAAGTCESQIECLNYFLRQLRENNIPPPNTS